MSGKDLSQGFKEETGCPVRIEQAAVDKTHFLSPHTLGTCGGQVLRIEAARDDVDMLVRQKRPAGDQLFFDLPVDHDNSFTPSEHLLLQLCGIVPVERG